MNESDFRLRPGERLDDLIRDGMRIIQRPDEFCYSLDSILLAQFASLKRNETVWDLGTGTGVIPLLLTSRGAARVEAVERNPVMADIARRNVAGNQRDAFITVLEADYREYRGVFPANGAGLVVVNPPYGELGRGAENEAPGHNTARHEVTATRADVIAVAAYLLKHGGRLALVQRSERATEWIAALEGARLPVKRLRWVHSYRHTPAKLVLLECRYGGHPGVRVEPPLIVYNAPGQYTAEVLALYGKEVPQ